MMPMKPRFENQGTRDVGRLFRIRDLVGRMGPPWHNYQLGGNHVSFNEWLNF